MPRAGGTLPDMQTEWSTADDDTTGAPATGSPGQAPHGQWGPGRNGDDDVVGTDDERLGEQELHRSAVEAVDGLLDEVELALARLDDGTYGRCDGCGEAIDDDRLAELPMARSCGRCDRADDAPVGADPAGPFESASA